MPPLLPKKETKAGGEPSYGLGLMAMLALVSVALRFLRDRGLDQRALAEVGPGENHDEQDRGNEQHRGGKTERIAE